MYTQKKPIENTHIVRERDRRRFRELLAVFSIGVPIGLFLLLFTWQNLEVIRLGHEATRLQQQRKSIEDANRALHLELDRLTALQAVEEKAAALGFEPSDPHAMVIVSGTPADMPTGSAPAAVPASNSPAAAVAAAGTAAIVPAGARR